MYIQWNELKAPVALRRVNLTDQFQFVFVIVGSLGNHFTIHYSDIDYWVDGKIIMGSYYHLILLWLVR